MKRGISWVYTAILNGCGILLFLEWLYPVKQLTEADHLAVYVIFALFCFGVSIMQVHFVIIFLLKGSGLLLIVHSLFFQGSLLSKGWLTELYGEIVFNIGSLMMQRYGDVTLLFRSMLFLLLIWLLSYLIHYWFAVTKRIFLFIILTFIYIAVLNTFTDYEADLAVIRTFVIAFTALGIAHFTKEMGRGQVRFQGRSKLLVWLFPLLGSVFIAAIVGYMTPVFESKWPDPVPFLQNAAKNLEKDKNNHLHKVGYGEDDSQLGGSFVQDYTTVFKAQAQTDHYWRIETKDQYTGKGWKNSRGSEYRKEFDGGIPLKTFADTVETEQLAATLSFQGNTVIEKLVYPYGAERVSTAEEVELLIDEHSGEIRTQLNARDVSLNHYTIHYQYPSFPIQDLRNAGNQDPAEIAMTYTQLPTSLPSRVDELAADITADHDNRYDKARAIERYFGRSGFVYQLNNVPIPEADQDYVDQFLFDTQAGYCDNYSTSMVVMLRSLDIPARWAKGFTSGDRIGEQADGTYLYEVTSANAHSWVEVYFPQVGWVPFEPTQGFSNLADFQMEREEEQDQEQEEKEREEEEEIEKQEEAEEKQREPEAEAAENEGAGTGRRFGWETALWTMLASAVLAVLLFFTRWRWMTVYYEWKWKRKQDAPAYTALYHYLLKMLRNNGMSKEQSETLREFATRVDQQFGSDEMGRLTHVYERMLYNNDETAFRGMEITELWKDLIRHMKG